MAGRPAPATRAAIERAILAAQATGLRVDRIVARADCYSIETSDPLQASQVIETEPKSVGPKIIL